jgi:hypothetical protein
MTFAAMGSEEERIAIEVFLLSLSASVLFCSFFLLLLLLLLLLLFFFSGFGV